MRVFLANFRGSPVIFRNRWWEWLVSGIVVAGLFLFVWWYHHLRGRSYDLFAANKSLAIGSFIAICLSLSLGSLRRLAGLPEVIFRLRRPLGVLAVVAVVLHSVISLFLLPAHFGWSFYGKKPVASLLGGAALVGLGLIAATSFKRMFERLGPVAWKRIHNLGYVLVGMIMIHYLLLGKPQNWVIWVMLHDQPVPPGTMLASVFGLAALLLETMDLAVGLFRREDGPGMKSEAIT
ncbi:MAG: hypothetical protein V1809_09790 [Planctomycetota bacterium]